MFHTVVLLLFLSSPFRLWFQGLMQPDDPRMSCCGEADAFEADNFEVQGDNYVAVITDGKGIIPNGTRVLVPNHKLKWDEGNPTGQPTSSAPARDSVAVSNAVSMSRSVLALKIFTCCPTARAAS